MVLHIMVYVYHMVFYYFYIIIYISNCCLSDFMAFILNSLYKI